VRVPEKGRPGFVRLLPVIGLVWACAGCATGLNYVDVSGPRYAGGIAPASPQRDTLRLVSFNLEFADSVDAAIRLLTTDPNLRNADLVFLQEMDSVATIRIADALRLVWVYYPSSRRNNTGRDFGNAILTRWPIESDEKLILPHVSYVGRTQRIAAAATIRIESERLRVYSTHLSTMLDMDANDRADQLRTILEDAKPYDRVVIAGDLNDEYVGHLALARGYAWPTHDLPYTARLFGIPMGTWDHIFLKGLAAGPARVVDIPTNVSDHKPVWAIAILR
jgi:endonuclease/exonuclease/phosphatase family metal-dependent hydrolase